MKYLLFLVCFIPCLLHGQSEKEKQVSDYLNSIRNNEALLTAFFQQMPKGGDLHHHYSGSIYAESYFEYVVSKNFWINTKTLEIHDTLDPAPSSDTGIKKFSTLQSEGKLDQIRYNLLRYWSVKDYNFTETAPDRHFFETFGRFSIANNGSFKPGFTELKNRAKSENVQYIETMFSSVKHGVKLNKIQNYNATFASLQDSRDSENLKKTFDKVYKILLDSGIAKSAEKFNHSVDSLHKTFAMDDSSFTIRYQTYLRRTIPSPLDAFASLVVSFISADKSDLIVGVNIVAPEDNPVSMENYWLHMQMFQWCKEKFPKVKFAMHAGELTLGLVKPEDLTWHINAAVKDAGAYRIGHGVDMAYEKNAYELLRYMKANKVAVEINLTSNEFILNVKENRHPITLYRNANVPIVISTDDAGILRSDLTEQFVLLASRYKEISYAEIKQYIFNSIEYSFIENEKLKNQLKEKLKRDIEKFEGYVIQVKN